MNLDKTKALNSYKYSWLLQRIYPYIRPVMKRVVLGILIAIPLGLLDGVTAFAIKPYMDYVVGQKDLAFTLMNHDFVINWHVFAYLIPVGVIAFAAFQGLLRYLNSYISEWTSNKITNAVKIDLFSHLVQMDTQFFDENSSGIILSRYLNDPQTAADGLVDQIKTITASLFGALGLIGVMLYSSWQLAIVGVLILCVAFIPVALIRNIIKDTSNKNMVINGHIRTNMNETYSGNKIMISYGLQERQKKIFEKEIHNSFDVAMQLIKRSGWMSPLMYLIASFGIATVLGYGTTLITTGQITAGSFASFVTSLLLLYRPVKTLGNTLTNIQKIFVALGRVFELFDYIPTIKDKPQTVALQDLHSNITFENVCFAYNEGKSVLKNINLCVKKGETIAIVGNSGGGKSTLVNLLPRFYDVTNGAVKFDGIDIRDFKLTELRDRMSVVFQDNFLFTGTIRENIMLANPNASKDDLNSVIDASHLRELIEMLPNGLDTLLGERGTSLSGGQRQRIAIARAMIRNTPIIILDEATSALDNESEAIVQKALDNLMSNKTVFVIAHRLSTIKNADRIIVINDGRIVEEGSHEELLGRSDGHYKHLYDVQFKNSENLSV